MKKFIVLTATLLLFAMLTAFADEFVTLDEFDGIRYRDFPESMVKIEEDSFRDNCALEKLIIPEGIDSIGENAFAGCTSIQTIVVLNPDAAIGTNALGTRDEHKVICGYKDSTAHSYAIAYGYDFVTIYSSTEEDMAIKQAILDYADTKVRAETKYSQMDCITFVRHCYIFAPWNGSTLKTYIPASCPWMYNLPTRPEPAKYGYGYQRIDSVADLQPGDIICWTDDQYWNKSKVSTASEPGDSDYKKCSHVGMYVADYFSTASYDKEHGITNRPANSGSFMYNISASRVFVESSNSTGGVRYNYFTDYYVRNFLCAWRILF